MANIQLEELNIPEGKITLVCGRTGSGKTTLLKRLKKQLGSEAGYIFQNPEDAIVCDKVYDQLAIGASDRKEIARLATYFGIAHWMERDTHKLSGGEKQILNIATVMATGPSVLLADEPVAMLDPVMADRVMDILRKINRELGVTIIIVEHINQNIIRDAACVIVADSMKYTMQQPQEAVSLCNTGYQVTKCESAPQSFAKIRGLNFGFERDKKIIRDLNLDINSGEILALLGGNGSGKTTLSRLICGRLKPYSGSIKIPHGKKASMLAQDVTLHFLKDEYDGRHPYDLSGGEKQLLAIELVLAEEPDLIVFDEPTKGLDAYEKNNFAGRLFELKKAGKALVVVTHDAELADAVADRTLMLFNGEIIED